MTATELVVSTQPFMVRRRVKWGECDPAGVVYTPVFAEYVISIAELFYAELLGKSPQQAKEAYGFGTPTRALSFDFQASLRPDQEFDVLVEVSEIRTRSYVLTLTGRDQTGQVIFIATHIPVCVRRDIRQSIDIPDVFRTALTKYKQSQAKDKSSPTFSLSETPI